MKWETIDKNKTFELLKKGYPHVFDNHKSYIMDIDYMHQLVFSPHTVLDNYTWGLSIVKKQLDDSADLLALIGNGNHNFPSPYNADGILNYQNFAQVMKLIDLEPNEFSDHLQSIDGVLIKSFKGYGGENHPYLSFLHNSFKFAKEKIQEQYEVLSEEDKIFLPSLEFVDGLKNLMDKHMRENPGLNPEWVNELKKELEYLSFSVNGPLYANHYNSISGKKSMKEIYNKK